MAVANTILIPELQYYFGSFLKGSISNKFQISYPVLLSDSLFPDCHSFVRLLFDDNWPRIYTNYYYLYREVSKANLPYQILTRIMLYSTSSHYYIADSDSTSECNINAFSLVGDDLSLLDKLLAYRTLDSTSIITITDIDYESLTTNLSKMVYLYLDLKLNNSVSNYDDESLLSDDSSVLENCYEIYLIENMFNYTALNTININPLLYSGRRT